MSIVNILTAWIVELFIKKKRFSNQRKTYQRKFTFCILWAPDYYSILIAFKKIAITYSTGTKVRLCLDLTLIILFVI